MRYFLLALSALFILASCKKLETVTTKEAWLRSGQWKYSSGSVKYKVFYSSPLRDTTVKLDSMYKKTCYSDNSLTFGAGYTGTVNTGGTKCTPGESDGQSFHWEFRNNADTILIYNAGAFFSASEVNQGAGNSINAQVTSLSQHSMAIKYYDTYEYTDPANKYHTIRDTLTYTMTLTN